MSIIWIVFVVPAILFVVFVAPIWLVLHYRSNRQLGAGLNEQEMARLTALVSQADMLQQRVHTLERLLDVESPNWRAEDPSSGRSHE
ncbi:MAG: envelope stress response membrane protein PspB [Aeromonadaceae bacterium]|nr:envelope stress response membrane protein PspB [Aeromonadaceae bacterium]MBP9568600.1 envelope stress response membrane protein PspB [Aeromonadaceae bacterium]